VPKSPKFRPVKCAAGWRVNIPSRVSLSGKRERHFHRTKDEALAEAARLRDHLETFGMQAASISPTLAEQAAKAAELLKPLGISLLEAASLVAEERRTLLASVPVEEALDAYEAAKENLSEKQRREIRYMATHLRKDFVGVPLSGIGWEEVARHIEARTGGDRTFNNRLGTLGSFWRWAAKPPRAWCQGDRLKPIERKTVTPGEIGILTAEECARLLAVAEAEFPDTVPAFAIAMFTGMRQAEVGRLNPCDITPEGITVPSSSAKTKRRRFIHMPEPLAAWLAAYPVGETVCPSNWVRKEKAVRRLAGWRVWAELVEPHPPPSTLPDWPQNALRHTAASVQLALGKPLETLIFEHGHAGGVEMLRRHYIGRMPRAEALAIWQTGPEGRKLPAMKIA